MNNICISIGMHDSSVTIIKDRKIVAHIIEERHSHHKHDCPPCLSMTKIKDYIDKVDRISFADLFPNYTDFTPYIKILEHFSGLCFPNTQYNKSLHNLIETPIHTDHHDLHAICGFAHSGFDQSLVVVMDGAGSTYSFGKENQTIYEISKDYIHVLEKNIVGDGSPVVDYSTPERDIPEYVNPETNIGAGYAYSAVSESCGFGSLECGKVMGLSAYGQPDDRLPTLLSIDSGGNYTFTLQRDQRWTWMGPTECYLNDRYRMVEAENIAYRIQKDYEKYLIYTCKKALSISKSRTKNLILTGGCALNCVANYKLLKELPDDVNLYVEPVSDDCGVSIGGAIKLDKESYGFFGNNLKLDNLYLGGQLEYDYQLMGNNEIEYDAEPENIAEIISLGNIVAIAQGRSEIGPRALGNRSILFDPRNPKGQEIVNQVKKREYFRPFAGTVLKEYAKEWFDMDKLDESPFMMYAVEVLPEKKDQIPSIIHVDGTCRIQTVTSEQNKNYYDLISEFYKLTGVPILFNTSFNLAGDTMVETIDDAFYTLRNSQINYMYLPEIGKLIQIN